MVRNKEFHTIEATDEMDQYGSFLNKCYYGKPSGLADSFENHDTVSYEMATKRLRIYIVKRIYVKRVSLLEKVGKLAKLGNAIKVGMVTGVTPQDLNRGNT